MQNKRLIYFEVWEVEMRDSADEPDSLDEQGALSAEANAGLKSQIEKKWNGFKKNWQKTE